MTATNISTEESFNKVVEKFEHPRSHFYAIAGATALLLGLGVVMVASASSVLSYQTYGNSFTLALRQFTFAILGAAAGFTVSRLSISRIRFFAKPLLWFSIGTLVLVLIPGIGSSVNGQQNWIELVGPIRFQPSEFAKFAMVLWAADVLARRYAYLTYAKFSLVPVAPVFLLILILVILEKDAGTAMVMLPIMMSVYAFIGAPKRWLGAVALAALSGIALLTVIAPYRMTRFTSWLDPYADPQGAGYQLIHGQQALGTGGWFGVGLGASREKWGTLPEAHTDFIYAVIGEELGIFGTIAVLLLFTIIGVVGFRIARLARDRFIQIAAAGITTWLVVQMLVNIGAVLGVMPITGVPLPLVSYGGSSLVPTLAALGALMAFSLHESDSETNE